MEYLERYGFKCTGVYNFYFFNQPFAPKLRFNNCYILTLSNWILLECGFFLNARLAIRAHTPGP